MCYELETGKVYEMTKAHEIFSGLGEKKDDAVEAETNVQRDEERVVELDDEEEEALDILLKEEELKLDKEKEEEGEVGIQDVLKEQTFSSSFEGIKVSFHLAILMFNLRVYDHRLGISSHGEFPNRLWERKVCRLLRCHLRLFETRAASS